MLLLLSWLVEGITFYHTPPKEVERGKVLFIKITVQEEVKSVNLVVKEKTFIMQRKEEGEFFVTLGGELIKGEELRYQFIITTKDNKILTSQEYKIPITSPSPFLVEFVSPSPYSEITEDKPQVVIIFEKKLIPSQIELLLDGKNVTSHCEINSYSLFYQPKEKLKTGAHILEIKIHPKIEQRCEFYIVEKKYFKGSWKVGGRRVRCNNPSMEEYLIYKPGEHLLFNLYGEGELGIPFSFWGYKEEVFEFNLKSEIKLITMEVGDIYPFSTDFTFYAGKMRGGGINFTQNNTELKIFGGKMEKLDTTWYIDTIIVEFGDTEIVVKDTLVDTMIVGIYPRYGGGIEWSYSFWKVVPKLICGIGWDDSLVLSEELREKSFFTPGIRNKIIGGRVEYKLTSNLTIVGEQCFSETHNHPEEGEINKGGASSLVIENNFKELSCKIGYKMIDKNYFTIGNPYLETDKKGIELEIGWNKWGIYYSGNYEVYKLEDSLEYDLYTTFTYSTKHFTPSLSWVYMKTYQNITIAGKFEKKKNKVFVSVGGGEGSFSFKGNVNWEPVKDIELEIGYFNSKTYKEEQINSINEEIKTEIRVKEIISIEYKILNNVNFLESECNYKENIVTLWLKGKL